MEEGTGGRRRGRRGERKRGDRRQANGATRETKRGQYILCVSLTRRSFLPVFKVCTGSIKTGGDDQTRPSLSADLNPRACVVIKGT